MKKSATGLYDAILSTHYAADLLQSTIDELAEELKEMRKTKRACEANLKKCIAEYVKINGRLPTGFNEKGEPTGKMR